MKTATVCFLLKDKQVLLAMKKRGFGVNKWNGVGGKVLEGETVEAAAVREIKEEIGVDVEVLDLEKMAEIEFYFPDKENWDMLVHVFIVREWKNEPVESEEMRPSWFALDKIPFDEMWIDDKYWLARVLGGEKLKGEFYLKGEGDSIAKYNTKTVFAF